jgi:DNA-binding MarR family transcriptional regulator
MTVSSPASDVGAAVLGPAGRFELARDGDAVRLWRAVGSDSVAVLLPLAEAPRRELRMHELAERSHLTPSGLTRRVDRLIERGWVTRRGCEGDRRVAYAVLTDAGQRELALALPFHAGLLERHVAPSLTAAERDRLIELLERIAQPGER